MRERRRRGDGGTGSPRARPGDRHPVRRPHPAPVPPPPPSLIHHPPPPSPRPGLAPVGTRALVPGLPVPAAQASGVLRGGRVRLWAAAREATFTADIGSDAMATVGFVWVGAPGRGRRLLPALRALGRPAAERVL